MGQGARGVGSGGTVSRWKARDSVYLSIPGLSPRIEWALNERAGRRYLLRGDRGAWMPVLIELVEGVSIGQLTSGMLSDDEPFIGRRKGDRSMLDAWRETLKVPAFLGALETELAGARLGFVTAYAYQSRPLGQWSGDDDEPAGFFDLLGENRNKLMQDVIRRVTLGLTLRPPSLSDALIGDTVAGKGREEIATQGAGKAVVMGVVDDAIAVAHDRFMLPPARGTVAREMARVKFAWVQDGQHRRREGDIVAYGAELTAQDINEARSKYAEESQRYRELGLQRYDGASGTLDSHNGLSQRTAHGTHVLDLMAGAAPAERETGRPIIAVQLPAATTADTSGGLLGTALLDAVIYILYRVATGFQAPRGERLPVVINCSYGYLGGPNDGTSPEERALDSLLDACRAADWPVALVLPSGNSHLSGCHAVVPTGRGTTTLNLVLQPDDHTPSSVEFWLPCGAERNGRAPLTLVVTPPSGPAKSMRAVVGRVVEWLNDDGDILCQVACTRVPAPTSRVLLMVTIGPTASLDDDPLVPCGIWRLTLEDGGLPADEAVHAWVSRDDSLHGHPRRGRQAYFADGDYVRFDGPDGQGGVRVDDDAGSLVQRGGSQNALATGREPLVVGAARGFADGDDMSPYSAGGPLPAPCRAPAQPSRGGPDVAAVGDHSAVHRGVLAAGSRSGSRVLMDGTSVAAPRVARMLADEMVAQRAAGVPLNEVVDAARAALFGAALAGRARPARAGSGVLRVPDDAAEVARRVEISPG